MTRNEAIDIYEKCASAIIDMDKLEGYGIEPSDIDEARNTILEAFAKLDDIENQPCVEGYKERTSKKVLHGLHALCLKGTDRAYWGMVRHMVEQIGNDLEVLDIIKDSAYRSIIEHDATKVMEYCKDLPKHNEMANNSYKRAKKLKEWLER